MGKKSKGGIRSMGDVTIREFLKTGKGNIPSKTKKEGEYVGVDRDAGRLTRKK